MGKTVAQGTTPDAPHRRRWGTTKYYLGYGDNGRFRGNGSRAMIPAHLSIRTNPSNTDHHLWNNNGTWYLHYTVCASGLSGTRRRESLGTHCLTEARRRRDRILDTAAAIEVVK